MEKIMSNLHMEKIKCSQKLQFVIEEDKNISDQSPDIVKILMEDGDISVEEIRPGKEFVELRGKLYYKILYLTDEKEKKLHKISGEIPWEEKVRIDGMEPSDSVFVEDFLEDMRSSCINSRKINIRALAGLKLVVRENYDEEVVNRIEEKEIEQKKENLTYSEVRVDRKDKLRMKEEFELPPSFPPIAQLLFHSIELNKWEAKPLEDHISIQAEMTVFLIYRSNKEEEDIKTYETTVKYLANLECPGSNTQLYESIIPVIKSKQLNVKQDEDGEDRILESEIVTELLIRLWEEKQIELVTDIYGTQEQIMPVYREGEYCRRGEKQQIRLKLSKTVRVPASYPKILQIYCTKTCEPYLEQIQQEGKVFLQGSIPFSIFYLTESEEETYGSLKEQIEFLQELEDGNTSEYEVWGMVQQCKTILLDGEETEVKINILLEVQPVHYRKKKYLQEVRKEESLREKRNQQPSMAVYRATSKESLWEIGKKYGIAVESIRSVNQLEDEVLQNGQKILLIR